MHNIRLLLISTVVFYEEKHEKELQTSFLIQIRHWCLNLQTIEFYYVSSRLVMNGRWDLFPQLGAQ